ncbi:MAG TPA: hypothetical protein VF707_18950 [Ardenticatenaceae bacterium]|jgi:hypothetical protein
MYAPMLNGNEKRWYVIETWTGEKVGYMAGYETQKEAQAVADQFNGPFVMTGSEQVRATQSYHAA